MADELHRWERTAARWVALATALAAVTVPIREWIVRDREIAVARVQQEFTIRKEYLDRAVDPARPAALRQGVLRFLVATSQDGAMSRWAQEELTRADEQVNALTADLAGLREAQAKAEERTVELTSALERMRKERTSDAKALADAKAAIVALERSKADTERRIASTADQLNGSDRPRIAIAGVRSDNGGAIVGQLARGLCTLNECVPSSKVNIEGKIDFAAARAERVAGILFGVVSNSPRRRLELALLTTSLKPHRTWSLPLDSEARLAAVTLGVLESEIRATLLPPPSSSALLTEQ